MSIQKSIMVSSAGQMQKIAGKIARQFLKKQPQKQAVVFGLRGELGSGKTTFLQGFAKGLCIKEKITSPTFVILKKFKIAEIKNFKNFYHLDCYRIQKSNEILELGWEKIIADPENIIAVEWAALIKDILPKQTIFIDFKHINENTREISIKI